MSPDHLPTTYEGKLDHIIEECTEVIKVVIKIKRFGLQATDPATLIEYNNLLDLINETDDVAQAVENFINFVDNS